MARKPKRELPRVEVEYAEVDDPAAMEWLTSLLAESGIAPPPSAASCACPKCRGPIS